MKLPRIFVRKRAMSFDQFRDYVRLAVRRAKPGAKPENTESGFTIRIDGHPIACNLRNLYRAYSIAPKDLENLVHDWLETLITEPPEQGWSEARLTLRPQLKPNDYISKANRAMARSDPPDSLPFEPFAGELAVICVREIGRNLFGVTQKQLDSWGVDLAAAMHEAVNNMNMRPLPTVSNEMKAGSSGRRGDQGETVGMTFEGDHLTATWIVMDRFRDHVSMQLQGDYVVAVPNRNRLIAVRADEAALVASVAQSNRHYDRMPYALTPECYLVSMTGAGGSVAVYHGDSTKALKTDSLFAGTSSRLPNIADAAAAEARSNRPVDLSAWGGLVEQIEEPAAATPWERGKR